MYTVMSASRQTASEPPDFTDHQLLFLISQPRAGSTLLQSVLAGIDGLVTTAEPWLMLHPTYALREQGHSADYDSRAAFRALSGFLTAMPGGRSDYVAALRLLGLHLYGHACASRHGRLFLDKSPRYHYILTELLEVFPNARFILLLRNPLAVLASVLSTWVRGKWARLRFYRDDLLLAPQRLVEAKESVTGNVFVMYYEDLVAAPEVQVSHLCAWLGEPYSPELLTYGQRPLPAGEFGDPTGIRRHSRPSPESLDRWQELGRHPQTRHLALAYLDALGQDTVTRMGYNSDALRDQLLAVRAERGLPWVTWEQAIGEDTSLLAKARVRAAGIVQSAARLPIDPNHLAGNDQVHD